MSHTPGFPGSSVARAFNVPIAEHCEDMTLARGGSMNEGIMSAKLGLKGIPAEAEEIYVRARIFHFKGLRKKAMRTYFSRGGA